MRYVLIAFSCFCFGIIFGQKKNKAPKIDSTQTYTYVSIHYLKGQQGLFDNRKNSYIFAPGNYQFIPFENNYIGIADLTNKKVAVLLKNEFIHTQTKWDTQQLAFWDSGFGYTNPLHANAYHSVRLAHLDITDNGKGYREKPMGFEDYGQLVFGLSMEDNGSITLFKTDENPTVKPLGKLMKITSQGIKTLAEDVELFFLENHFIWKMYPKKPASDFTEENTDNNVVFTPSKVHLSKELYSFESAVLRCDCTASADTVSYKLCRFDEYSQPEKTGVLLGITTQNSLTDSTYYKHHIQLNDEVRLHYNSFGTFLLTGNKEGAIGILSKYTASTENYEIQLYPTHTAHHYFVHLNSKNELSGMRVGVLDIAKNQWVVQPKYWHIVELDHHYYARIMTIERENDDDFYEVLKQASLYDAKGNIVIDFGNREHHFDEAFNLLGIDSIQDAGIHYFSGTTYYFTYEKNKKGLIKYDTYYGWPTRVVPAKYEELVINTGNSHFDDCAYIEPTYLETGIGIMGESIDVIKINEFHSNVYYTSTLEEFRVSKINYLNGIEEVQLNLPQTTNPTWGNSNYGYAHHKNKVIITLAENTKEKSVPLYDENGDMIFDVNGYEQMESHCTSNSSNSGVYDKENNKWIIAPNKHWITYFGGNYLVQEYDQHNAITSFIYDQNGLKMRQIFEQEENLKADLSSLFIAKKVYPLGHSHFAIETLDSQFNVIVPNYSTPPFILESNLNLLGLNDNLLVHNKITNCYSLNDSQTWEQKLNIENDLWGIQNIAHEPSYLFYDTLFFDFQTEEKVHDFLLKINYGKYSLPDKNKTIVINSHPGHMEQFYDFDEWGYEELKEFYLPGKYFSGLFNHSTNRWDLAPVYDRIYPNAYGYTAIQTDDIDKDNVRHTYSFYSPTFQLIANYTDTAQKISEQPGYFKYLHPDLKVDSCLLVDNSRINNILGDFMTLANLQTVYKTYSNGQYGLIQIGQTNKYTSINSVTSYSDLTHFDPLRKMPVSVAGDSLFINNISVSAKNSTIQLYSSEYSHLYYRMMVRENDTFSYFQLNDNHQWEQLEAMDTSNAWSTQIVAHNDLIHIQETPSYLDFYFFITDDYYLEEDNTLRGFYKLNDDVIWKKETGQWKELAREEKITPTPLGMNYVKSTDSSSWPKHFGSATSVITDTESRVVSFGSSYKNPVFLYSLSTNLHVIEFDKDGSKVYTVVDNNNTILVDSFVNYSFENEILYGMEYDEFGDFVVAPTPIEIKK
jgi:hypothetical protein